MFIPDRLKQDFPQFTEELNVYAKFLIRTHGKEYNAYKIFDDQKENFKLVQEAYQHYADCGKHDKQFNKLMATYEKTLNEDKDFLAYFVHQFYDIDGREMTVSQLKQIIDEKFKQIDKLQVGA